jgi:site-specific DNA recombinase
MLVTPTPVAALYARVSSERQVEAQTVGSQLAALRERAMSDGLPIAPEHEFVDEGYSGATLIRPALEQVRDLAALGGVEVLYVHSPDRLARKYVHQVLLLEEFARAGVRVVFLNQAQSQTPEDELLLQVQGVIAEYERTKIMERVRRGRRHAARLGSLSALAHAPYGYLYRGPAQGADSPRNEVVLDEARVVRQLFAWVGRERLSIGAVARRLTTVGIPTRTGKVRWDRGTVGAMLHNPAYKGEAAYGRTRSGPWHRQTLRPVRGKSAHPRQPATAQRVPPTEWLTLAVPPLVDPVLFAAVQEQLAGNQRRARVQVRGARHLLQGLLVCGDCGYAIPGSIVSYRTRDGSPRQRTYYRCRGRDAPRIGAERGEPLCHTAPVAAESVEAAVWAEVRAVLEDPTRLAAEYARRAEDIRERTAQTDGRAAATQLTKLRQGLGRLIDTYTEGLIGKEEFEPRLARLRQCIAALERQIQQEADEASATHDLHLLVGQLDAFAIQVRAGLADADWQVRREIIRALVKEVEVTTEQITVVFRIGPQPVGPAPPPDHLPHCLSRLAPQTSGGTGARIAAKAAGDFLLHLQPAQIAFCLVVVEGDGEVIEEGEHRILVEQQPFEQVAGRRLLDPAALSRSAGVVGRRIGRQSGGQQRPVAGHQRIALAGRQAAQALGPCRVGCRLHLAQQLLALRSPSLLVLLLQQGEFAQMVHVVPRMAAGSIGPVADPPVMHAHARMARRKVWQDANGRRRLPTTLGVDRIVDQVRRAGHVRPGEPARPAHPAVIMAQRPCPPPRGLERDLDRLQHPRRRLDPADQAATSQLNAEQVGQQLLTRPSGTRCSWAK